jgi:osmotically-inducible protein OsmY
VHLAGTVDTQASVDHAADLARQVHGVKGVDTSGLKTGGN